MRVRASRLGGWARSVLEPEERLLPGIGHRLDRHPRLAGATLVALRSVPGRRLRGAMYRYFSRPLARRMTASLVVPVDGGIRIRADMGDIVGSVLATSGVWEPYVVAAMARELTAGDVFVDVGAHVGYQTLVASKLVGPQGHVYALEPAAATYRDLCGNLELNKASNVSAIQVAAGEGDGYAEVMNQSLDTTGKTAVRRYVDDGSETSLPVGLVPVRALASLLDAPHVERLRLVKIDVEGFEGEVLRGLERLFESGARPSVIVELHRDGVQDAMPVIERLVTGYGLSALELVRNAPFERFAAIPAPRRIEDLGELPALCSVRTANVLLKAPVGAVPPPSATIRA